MRRLRRPEVPEELRKAAAASERRQKKGKATGKAWSQVPREVREAVHERLATMQSGRCAYCETNLKDGQHVDHFRKQADFPDLALDWDNLFLSCGADAHCARHKDRLTGEARPRWNLLVDPARDDPEDTLRFRPDGRVVPHPRLDDHARRRAEETIRVFALNEPGRLNDRTSSPSHRFA